MQLIVENKKIKNAQEHIYNGIKFKSKLERTSYILLKEAGFDPQYEKQVFEVWKGQRFSVPCYDLHNDRKLKKDVWGINTYKPYSIKYTPDFTFYITDASGIKKLIVIESKGFANERYAYVKKLFRDWLEKNNPESLFFEVHTQKQVKAAIEIIKSINND